MVDGLHAEAVKRPRAEVAVWRCGDVAEWRAARGRTDDHARDDGLLDDDILHDPLLDGWHDADDDAVGGDPFALLRHPPRVRKLLVRPNEQTAVFLLM